MKLCLAMMSGQRCSRIVNEEEYPHLLNSFAYAANLKRLAFRPKFLMIDSGAFSVWRSGKTIDVQDYARYADTVSHKCDHMVFVNLDVIPGTPDRMAEEDEKKHCMDASLRNADYLRASGLEVMEVFHQGEPFDFLDHLLSRLRSGQMLGLSPRNNASTKQRTEWARLVLGHMLKTRTPQQLPRCHGLACTTPDLLSNFPFYSVDSTTWGNCYIYGKVVTEQGRSVDITTFLPSSRPRIAQDAAARRSIHNCRKVEKDYTHLWETRGVRWTD